MERSKLRGTLIRLVTRVHAAVFRGSGGRLASRGAGMPVLMLTTTGRKSGQPCTAMLTSPVQDGDKIVLVASFGGSDRHPAWFLNLRDNPAVDVLMNGRSGSMRARVASQEEKSRLWPRVVKAYSGYEAYQQRTSRDIPLVILEP
jgi:deazaflavin-dependent oxidoreductase (nitroreductase family)